MTRNEFIWKIDHGDDIMFDVAGKHYTILTWPDEGITIGEQNVNAPGMVFPTPEALVDEFTVDGIPLAELVEDIVITCYTLVRE